MKKITLPNVRQFPSGPKCCGTKLSRDFIFPNDVPDACCGAFSLNFGSGTTELDELNSGPFTVTNSCDATVRFYQTSNFGDTVILNVGGTDHTLIHPSDFPGYTDILIPAGSELSLFVQVFGGEVNVQITMKNLTCDQTNDTLIFNYTMDVPACCGLQTYPMAAPVDDPGDYWDTFATPYIVQGTCDSDLTFSVTYDRIIDDPFYSVDVYHNGNAIGLTVGGDVTITVSPGDDITFQAIMGLVGIGPGIFTFSVQNLTCATGTDVVWVCELGA